MDIEGMPDAYLEDVQWWTNALSHSVIKRTTFDFRLMSRRSPREQEMNVPPKLPAQAVERVVRDFANTGHQLHIRCAGISGTLMLDANQHLIMPLSITDSIFDKPVYVDGRLSELSLNGSTLPALEIHGSFSAVLSLAAAKVTGPLMIARSVIDGPLILDEIEVEGPARLDNVKASIATISNAHLQNGLVVQSLTAAALILRGSTLRGEPALSVRESLFGQSDSRIGAESQGAKDDLDLTGTVDLTNVEATGRVDIWRSVGHHLDLSNATLRPVDDADNKFALTLDPVSHVKPSTLYMHYPFRKVDSDSTFETRSTQETEFDKVSTSGLLIAGRADAAAKRRLGRQRAGSNHAMIRASLVATSFFSALPIAAVASLVAFAAVALPGSTSATDPVATIGFGLFTAAVSGLISCALLENMKRLLRLRGVYQMLAFRMWLNRRVGDRDAGLRAYTEFIVLTGGSPSPHLPVGIKPSRGHSYFWANLRLFDLPVEQLAAQLFDVTETVLSDPKRHRFFCRALGGVDFAINHPDSSADPEFQARARRSVDNMQITLGDGWRRYLAGAATALSGLVGIFLVEMYEVSWQDPRMTVLLSTFVGGFAAWLIRDLTVAASKFRR